MILNLKVEGKAVTAASFDLKLVVNLGFAISQQIDPEAVGGHVPVGKKLDACFPVPRREIEVGTKCQASRRAHQFDRPSHGQMRRPAINKDCNRKVEALLLVSHGQRVDAVDLRQRALIPIVTDKCTMTEMLVEKCLQWSIKGPITDHRSERVMGDAQYGCNLLGELASWRVELGSDDDGALYG